MPLIENDSLTFQVAFIFDTNGAKWDRGPPAQGLDTHSQIQSWHCDYEAGPDRSFSTEGIQIKILHSGYYTLRWFTADHYDLLFLLVGHGGRKNPVPAPVRPEDCQSGVGTPKAPSVPQHTLLVPLARQRLV